MRTVNCACAFIFISQYLENRQNKFPSKHHKTEYQTSCHLTFAAVTSFNATMGGKKHGLI